jgi:hypothetical protein
MRTHSLVSAAALSLGLALAAPAVFAQETSDGGAVRRWPTAADGAASVPTGRTAVARGAVSAEVSRPAERAAGTIDGGRVSSGDRITVDQGQLEQRRSPGGSGGGTVRGGGGTRGGDGGARVAVPRGSGGGGRPVYPGGAGRRTVIVQPRGYYGYPYYYPRYYYPYSSFYYGAGYFDTFGYWGAGWGPGFGYSAYPYGGYGYPGYAYSGYGYNTGRVRLEVQPRDAEVFIDGYYAGQVDDFDGRLQGLTLETGGYSVEIRKPGWETLTFDVRVTPGRTTHYKGELIPTKP